MFLLTEENISKQTSIINFTKGKTIFLKHQINYDDIYKTLLTQVLETTDNKTDEV